MTYLSNLPPFFPPYTQIFRPDEFITKEGQVSDRIYILAKGRVEVVKWGKIRVAVLETGAYFGEAGFLCEAQEPEQHK